MNIRNVKLISSIVLVVFLSCVVFSCKKDQTKQPSDQSKSSQKDILTFEFFRADNSTLTTDYNTGLSGNAITATLPPATDLTSLKAAFTVSEKATVTVNGKLQTSRISANDFTQPVIYTVKAEDGSTKTYTVIVNTK